MATAALNFPNYLKAELEQMEDLEKALQKEKAVRKVRRKQLEDAVSKKRRKRKIQ